MIKRFLKLAFLLLLLVVIVGPIVIVVRGIEQEPLVTDVPELTSADVSRAQSLLERNDPRALRDGEVGSAELSERDVNLMLAYIFQRLDAGAARTELQQGNALIEVALRMPDNPLGRFFNLAAELVPSGDGVAFDTLRIGDIAVPAMLANGAATLAHRLLSRDDTYREAVGAVDRIEFGQAQVRVRYQWQESIAESVAERGLGLLDNDGDLERVLAYSDYLQAVAAGSSSRGGSSLSGIIRPVFQEARARSGRGGDPVVENRAALLTLGMYVVEVDPAELVGAADRSRSASRWREFTLAGRQDLAQHFAVSAALTAAAGGPLAEVVGLQKEVLDSEGGSGFSFADLAADRAGVRFAERALESPDSAREVQHFLADSQTESDYMVDIAGLPEFMGAAEFQRRFQAVGSDAYQEISNIIDRRLDLLPLSR